MTALDMLDFHRSFLTFSTLDRGNNARIQIESRCLLVDGLGEQHRYVLIASCKAEDTYGSGPLFKQPNYDFSGVFSESDYAIYRLFASADDNQPESGPLSQLFDRIDIRETPLQGARELNGARDIVNATRSGLPLCGRTTFRLPGTSYTAVIDYPIKTMNVNPERERFQVDTGPVLFPRVELLDGQLVDCFAPAFVAYQTLDRAEFILLDAVAIPHADVRVNHYSATIALDVETVIIAAE